MAVTFNNTNTMQEVTGTSVTDSTNMSVTAGGSNLVAFCVIAFDGAGSAISSITYGGNTMTSCGSPATGGANLNSQIFYLINPPTGTNTLIITGNASVVEFYYNLVSFTGVNQTTPVRPGTYTTSSGTADPGPASITITSNINDLTLSAIEPNTSTTTNQTEDSINTGGLFQAYSDHATTAASSVTHTWTDGGAFSWALAGFSIQSGGAVVVPSIVPSLVPSTGLQVQRYTVSGY